MVIFFGPALILAAFGMLVLDFPVPANPITVLLASPGMENAA